MELMVDGGEENFLRVIPEAPVLSQPHLDFFESILRDRLRHRDWRQLRGSLINLDLDQMELVSKWLASAGYIPQAAMSEPSARYFSREDVANIANETLGWKPEYVTPAIIASLKKYRDVFAWLMGLGQQQFRRAVEQAFEFDDDRRERNRIYLREILSGDTRLKLKDPAIAFMAESKAPAGTDPETVRLCLQGTGTAQALSARFWWHSDGKPIVTIDTNSPLNAIGLSIHIDRNFSRRNWIVCDTCGKGRDRTRGRDRFCSARCRHRFNTTKRREKIKLLLESERAWAELPEWKRRGKERWRWISARVERVSRGNLNVDPSWAKRELSKIKARKQNRRRDVTRKAQ